MFKEWLLVVWLGTTTNFVILDVDVSQRLCEEKKLKYLKEYKKPYNLECKQNFAEGRGQYPPRHSSQGLVKK